jgi:hypothetical protein
MTMPVTRKFNNIYLCELYELLLIARTQGPVDNSNDVDIIISALDSHRPSCDYESFLLAHKDELVCIYDFLCNDRHIGRRNLMVTVRKNIFDIMTDDTDSEESDSDVPPLDIAA